jgi:hypothetical protein
MSLLLTPPVADGGVSAAVCTCYALALALGLIVAALAARVSGSCAAPLAVILVLFTPAAHRFATVVSDLPSATLLALEALLLTRASAPWRVGAAGALAGFLVWMRPPALLYLLAGIAGLTALPERRDRVARYLIAAIPIVLLFGGWQWWSFGSPFKTSSQAAAFSPAGRGDLGAFFSPAWIWTRPVVDANWVEGTEFGGAALAWHLPNGLLYPLQLAGADAFLLIPGIGVMGVIGLCRQARTIGAAGAFGRFGSSLLVLNLGDPPAHQCALPRRRPYCRGGGSRPVMEALRATADFSLDTRCLPICGIGRPIRAGGAPVGHHLRGPQDLTMAGNPLTPGVIRDRPLGRVDGTRTRARGCRH